MISKGKVAQLLETHHYYVLLLAFSISAGIILPRFNSGIPMSIDTTSHLYRVMFLNRWLGRGVLPFWTSDWYAGSPSLLLYPPLSYYMAVLPSLLGVDPLFSYKIVDALFYLLAPASLYFLGKELGFPKTESALGALFFSVAPEVIENYVFFDRFPTVIAIPIFCVFVVFFHRALIKSSPLSLLGSILALSAITLSHHLSGAIAGIVSGMMVLVGFRSRGMVRPLCSFAVVGMGTMALTAFWSIPLLESLSFFSANSFYNRNVTFPFLRFQYFAFDVASFLLGIAHFVLAAIAVQSILGREFGKRIPIQTVTFFSAVFVGMMLFEVGETANYLLLMRLGQAVVIVSFIFFFLQFLMPRARNEQVIVNGPFLAVIWFILFLWLGLGYHAFPVFWLPLIQAFWIRTMDVYRIWLYLSLPMSILAAWGLVRSIARFWERRRLFAILIICLAITPVTIGVGLKLNHANTSSVNSVLPYSAANAEIPEEVINYFRNDPSPGRVLGINVPLWIYVLPNYVDKPIIDGWYPQTKLMTQLVEINDYRINDLETAPDNTTRMETWRRLIAQADTLQVTWIMIGGSDLADVLMMGTGFTQNLSIPSATAHGTIDLIVFKNNIIPSFVETKGLNVKLVSVYSPTPDEFVLTFDRTANVSEVMVKEAYFPTWSATADGHPLNVTREDSTGYISLTIPANTQVVRIYHSTTPNLWGLLSGVAAICFLLISIGFIAKERKARK